MKKDNNFSGKGIIIAVLLLWLSYEIIEKTKIKNENQALKKSRLKLIKEYLTIANEIPSEIKVQIEKLVTEYENLDSKVAKELLDVLNLIEQKMEPKAIASLAKIIENLLKDQFAEEILKSKNFDENTYANKKKKITFFNLLEYAKSINFLSKHEYNLLNLLREYRNKSSHELGVEFSKNWQIIAFLTGIEIVFKLKGHKAV